MYAQLKFQRLTNFTGRNGYFQCSGVELMTITDNKVMLSPLTSKGEVARCDIAIPMEDIPVFIEQLMVIYSKNYEVTH